MILGNNSHEGRMWYNFWAPVIFIIGVAFLAPNAFVSEVESKYWQNTLEIVRDVGIGFIVASVIIFFVERQSEKRQDNIVKKISQRELERQEKFAEKFSREIANDVFTAILGIKSESLRRAIKQGLFGFKASAVLLTIRIKESHGGLIELRVSLQYSLKNISAKDMARPIVVFCCCIDAKLVDPTLQSFIVKNEFRFDDELPPVKYQHDDGRKETRDGAIGMVWEKPILLRAGETVSVNADYRLFGHSSGYLPWFSPFLATEMHVNVYSEPSMLLALVPTRLREVEDREDGHREWALDSLLPLQGFVVAWAPKK